MVQRFTGTLLLCVLSLIVLFVAIDLIDNLDRFIDYHASIGQVSLYYFYFVPYIVTLVMPLCLLMASMFVVTTLVRYKEVLAMQSAGISFLKIFSPLLRLALLLSLLILILAEILVPPANEKKIQIKTVIRKDRSQWIEGDKIKKDFHYQGSRNLYRFGEYNSNTQSAKAIIIETREDHRPVRRVDAEFLQYDEGHWVLKKGADRRLHKGQEQTLFFEELMADSLISEKPEDFYVRIKLPEEMGFFELKGYIEKKRVAGESVQQYVADLYYKVSYPLINFILTLLGTALAVKIKKPSFCFGVSLLVGFVCFGILNLGLSLGHSGYLSPLVSALLPSLLFLGIGLFLFFRLDHQVT